MPFKAKAQTNPTAQSLPYTQDFSGLDGTKTTYPDGWQAWQVAGATPNTTGRTDAPASDKGIAGGTAASSGSGAYDYNGKIGFLSGTTSDVALCLAVNTTGKSNIKIIFDAMTIRNPWNPTASPTVKISKNGLVLQYRVGTTGDFTTLSYLPAEYSTNETNQETGTVGMDITTGLNAVLPAGCDNQSVVQIRWIYKRLESGKANGNRPTMALDNIEVKEISLPKTTYTWIGVDNADWTVASNWNPTRTSPNLFDVLQFNDGTTKTITNVISQNISQLKVTGNTTVTLQSAANAILAINGDTGDDFIVESGSTLNIQQPTNTISVSLSSGTTGNVAGTINLDAAAHKISATDENSLIFASGGILNAQSSFSGNAFGTTSYNSVKFNAGATYVQGAGGNPFGANAPNNVAVFETGSLYKFTSSSSNPPFSGRTYANLEIDISGTTTCAGTNAVNMDNLTITNGTLNFNVTATPGHNIKGNIAVATGATLNFDPSSAGTVNFIGSSTQNISGAGTITTTSNSTLVFNNNINCETNILVNGALNIESAKTLTVSPAKELNVTGSFANNGTMTLKSSAAGTATFLSPAITSGSGTVNVEQHLNAARNWYISSPVTAATTATGMTYYTFDETSNDWTSVASGNAYEVGKGYIAQAGEAKTITFSGTLNNGNLAGISLTHSATSKAGFNLVGNPYPSFIEWTENMSTAANVLPTFWYRTKPSSYAFHTFNVEGGISSPQGLTNKIPPMQAFWVKALSGGGTLNFTNTMRVSDNTGTNKLKAKATSETKILRLQVSNGSENDETVIYYHANASDAYDRYDSPKMRSSAAAMPEIFTQENNEILVMNGKANISNYEDIHLGFASKKSGMFSIAATQISNFEPDTAIELIDMQENTSFDLKNGAVYSFHSNSVETLDRFIIKYKSRQISTGNNALQNDCMVVSTLTNCQIKIQLMDKAIKHATFRVHNALGQLVLVQQINSENTIVQLPTKGLYVLTLDGGQKSQKVITK